MKKLVFIICILSFIISSGNASTIVLGGTTVGDTGAVTWDTIGAPYIIDGDIFIENLTILPGVQISIVDDYLIQVTGILKAQGTYNNNIIFKAFDSANPWLGINFTPGSSRQSTLSFCTIKETKSRALLVEENIFPIRNCTITANRDHGIYIDGALVTIENSTITGNGKDGIRIETNNSFGTLVIKNSLVTHNGDNGIYSEGNFDQIDMSNSVIADNNKGGIVCQAGFLVLVNSIVYFNNNAITSTAIKTNITYSNINSTQLFPGIGNIKEAPDFIDNLSYHLNITSPCIDRGDSSLTHSDIYFPPSIGTRRNDMGAYGGPGAGKWIEQLSIDSSYINFGPVGISTPLTKPVLLRNETDSIISVSDVSFTEQDSPYFSTEDFNFSVASQDNYNLDLLFSPNAERYFSTEATVTNNKGAIKFLLMGEGLVPVIALSDSQLTFDTVAVGEDSLQEITIYNNGHSDLVIYRDSLNISGADSAHFSIEVPSENIIIPIADSAEIVVAFRPLDTGNKAANFDIVSNDPVNPHIQIDLNGVSTKSVISVSPTLIDFGVIEAMHDSIQIVTIYNSGSAELKVPKDSLLISGSADFAIDIPGEDLKIATNDSASLSITFAPVDSGYKEAQLNIYSNDYTHSPLTINLSGGSFVRPKISLSDTTLDFGALPLQQDSLKQFTIYNHGSASLMVYKDSLYIQGNGAAHFNALPWSSDLNITKGDSAVVQIRFRPTSSGNKEATLKIVSNDPLNPVKEIILSGQGSPKPEPVIYISPASLNFTQVEVSKDSLLELIIYNIGQADLNIFTSNLKITGKDSLHFYFVHPSWTPQISFGDSIKMNIGFAPLSDGPKTAILNINSNDPSHPESHVELKGIGIQKDISPEIGVLPAQVQFNNAYVENDYTEELKVFNKGVSDLIIYSDQLQISDDGASYFSFDTVSEDKIIPQNDTLIIIIHFIPENTLEQNATLMIYSNDINNSPQEVLLSGTGIEIPDALIELDLDGTTTIFTYGENADMTFSIMSETTVDSAYLNYKNGGENTFRKIGLSNTANDSWQTQLPGNLITERGMQYFVEVYHGKITHSDTAYKPVKVPLINFPQQTRSNRYQLISVPLDMDQQTLADLLIDDLGAYNNSQYRVFDYNNDDSKYVELTNLNKDLPAGKSLWLITKNPQNIDIENGTSVFPAGDYQINLKAGWNMIASPFAFPVAWSDIDTLHRIRDYDGTDWGFPDIMQPYEGYIVKVKDDSSIYIPAIETTALPKTSKGILAGAEWYFRISGEGENVYDRYNYIGVKATAKNKVDKNDHPEPPPIGNFLAISLIDKSSGKKYSTDFREPHMNGYQFNIRIESNVGSSKSIEFFPQNLPENYDWTVVSEKSKMIYARDNLSVSNNQNLILFVGTTEYLNDITEDFKSVPAKIALKQNYPNPFNPQTNIAFELTHRINVQIHIFDILGKHVKTLLNNQLMDPGYHTIKWDGLNDHNNRISSGIYFLHFKAGSYLKTIKMIMNN